jgi:glycosyltransferase involved in cell wall biosynthesis
MEKAHDVNEAWFASIDVHKSYPFNISTSRKLLSKLGGLNQILGFLHSLFIPNAKLYLLTSTGCSCAVILKKIFLKSKIIAINSDTFFTDLENAKGIKRFYMSWLLKHIDAIISTSEMMKNLSEKHTKVPNKVVYPFCEAERFTKVNPKHTQNICSIGIGTNTKGTDILLDAFRDINKKIPNAKLIVCGNKDSLKGMNIPDNCIFPGIVDPAPHLENSGLYINASRHESFGVNILEAMNAGIPAIVSNRCGAAELIEQIDSSLIVEPSAKEIAKKSIALLKNPEQRIVLGKKSRKIAKKYSKTKSVASFKKIFTELNKK